MQNQTAVRETAEHRAPNENRAPMKNRARIVIASALVAALTGCSFDASSSASTAPHTAAPSLDRDLAAPPEIRSSHGTVTFALAAAINSVTNLPGFLYEGLFAAPTIRVNPGDTIVVEMDDELPPGMGEASDMNLHFHGLNVSPMRPHDDVLTMLARPGRSLYYIVKVPPSQPPGLYWYHPHVHGETNYQVGQGGMSGAIVVEGIAKHLPALAKMPERLMIVRQLGRNGGEVATAPPAGGGGEADDHMDSMDSMGSMAKPHVVPVANHPCAPLGVGEYLSINNQVRPTIAVKAGEPQFFRVLNATGHRHLDLSLGGIPMQIVAIDGYPIDTNPAEPTSLVQTHIVVPPAARVEFVATIPASTQLRTLCFDSGPIGDPDPPEILADLRTGRNDSGVGSAAFTSAAASLPPLRTGAPLAFGGMLPPPATTRLVRFSEDVKGFYINGKMFSPSAPPMFVVHTGTVERWHIENLALEDHDFHLHQVHFLVEAQNGVPLTHQLWRDTVVVPHRRRLANGTYVPGSVTVIADFRDPQIRGIFLFHCHILDHEDQGMMAKIQAI
jgi:FtsP/CotA-like multicopper oxidase with cupredoxin domain